jgi:hypothetical protein
MASITSPEQGAQQECINTRFLSGGKLKEGRMLSVMGMLGMKNIKKLFYYFVSIRRFKNKLPKLTNGFSLCHQLICG